MIAHHHPRAAISSPSRRRRHRGAVTVELAIVSMFLITLLAGAYDYGQGWRSGLIVNEGARSGARVGSALGPDPLADWYALSAARASLSSGGKLATVTKVVVFKATATNGGAPANCINGASSTTELCNVITGDQFRAMTQASFAATTGCFTALTIKNWCPSSRNNIQLTADSYGIWIQYTHNKLFPFTGRTLTVTRDAVMRLEPREAS